MKREKAFPVIGVTVDRIEAEFPSETSYSVRCNYVDALTEAGAFAVLLPFEIDAITKFVEFCDGFLVTGSVPGNIGSSMRQTFDQAIIRAALSFEKPILGICNGMQMMGLVLGGELLANVSMDADAVVAHNRWPVPNRVSHEIAIAPRSTLAGIRRGASSPTQMVNSLHTQALASSGDFNVSATASDGVVEALEVPFHPFALGVQWHPEYLLTAFDRAIFSAFVAACRS